MLLYIASAWAALTGCSREPGPIVQTALPHQAYIWQYRWKAPLLEAIAASASEVQGWRVLVGELSANGGMRPIAVDWNALRDSRRPVVPVVRIEGRHLPKAAQERIVALLNALPAGLGQIELDFDSGTQGLAAYRKFIADLRPSLPPATRIGITLLPDWLDSPALPELLSAVDSSVLQLHGVLGQGHRLFDAAMAERWVRRMLALRRPFFIALPTYGSRVTLDESGHPLAVESEMPQPGTGDLTRELFVPPAAVANFLRALKAPAGSALQGIVWFRLPLDSDRRAWSRATWLAVMRQAPLPTDWRVEWQPSAAGSSEGRLTLLNLSSIDNPAPAIIGLSGRCTALDSGTYLLDSGSDGTLVLARKEPRLIRGQSSFALGPLRCTGTPGNFRVSD